MGALKVARGVQLVAAFVTAAGLALATSALPARAGTLTQDLAGVVPALPGVTTSPVSSGAGPGPAAPSRAATSAAAIATGNTLSYNEGSPGYCTWWAINEFHAYTGLYPDFGDPANDGDAGYWATNAAYNGWTVTSTPTVDSIAVFPPGVDGAEADGHVAWVTGVSGPQITISEMNGPAGWNATDTRSLTPDSSVSYILAP